jgi:hypothetical protein
MLIRQRQIRVLQEFVISERLEADDKQAIIDLVITLQRQGSCVIYKSDLAREYGVTPITFNKRIKQTEGLWNELYEKYGYTKWRKYFFPSEVELIKKCLGDPKTKTI